MSHDDANDILQNTFIKAWTNIDYFRGDAKLSTWLYRIALNECLNFLNRQRAQENISIDEADSNFINMIEGDTYFDGDETQVMFQKAIRTLPEKQRIIFNLRYFQEMKYEDISEIVGTTKQRIIFNLRYFQEMKYEDISEIVGTTVGALKASYHHAVKKIEEYFKQND